MHSYFNEQKIDQMGSSRIMLDGATPYVDPKVGSNSEVLIQSEISNMESMRSIKQETKPHKLMKNDSYAIRFNGTLQQSRQGHLPPSSSFKHEEKEHGEKDDRLKNLIIREGQRLEPMHALILMISPTKQDYRTLKSLTIQLQTARIK